MHLPEPEPAPEPGPEPGPKTYGCWEWEPADSEVGVPRGAGVWDDSSPRSTLAESYDDTQALGIPQLRNTSRRLARRPSWNSAWRSAPRLLDDQ